MRLRCGRRPTKDEERLAYAILDYLVKEPIRPEETDRIRRADALLDICREVAGNDFIARRAQREGF